MKIAIYTIAKNEEDNIDGWWQSCRDADSITFCDTGSTDDTKHTMQSVWANAGHPNFQFRDITIAPWRFDFAHNAALALVPADADLCIPLHLDERLTPGWRERIESAYESGAEWVQKYTQRKMPTSLLYPYTYDANTKFMQNRIHARKGYMWRYPTHEGPFPYFDTVELQARVTGDMPLIVQIPPKEGQREGRGDLKMLEYGLQEAPGDVHLLWYYGRELMLQKQFAAGAEVLRDLLKHPDTLSTRHHRDAARFLAICYHNLGGDSGDVA